MSMYLTESTVFSATPSRACPLKTNLGRTNPPNFLSWVVKKSENVTPYNTGNSIQIIDPGTELL